MQFILQTFETEGDFARRTDETSEAYWAAWDVYTKALQTAGVMVSGEGLQEPWTATTIRVRDGQIAIQDGPFAEGREQFAGFYVIDVPSIDDAIKWAARAPSSATGCVEIRPLMTPPS